MTAVAGGPRAYRVHHMPGFPPRVQLSPQCVETDGWHIIYMVPNMKKVVPDPPHAFDLPPGKTLCRAIGEGIVPMEHVLMNVSHYLMFAYSDSRRALERIEDEETRQQLQHGLRAMQIAWGQADALALAVERKPGLR